MSKVAVLVVAFAAVLCIEAVPVPQYPFQDPAFQAYQQFMSTFQNGNGVLTSSSSDGNGYTQTFSSGGGSGGGNQQGFSFTSFSEPGKPTVVHETYNNNGKITEKKYTINGDASDN